VGRLPRPGHALGAAALPPGPLRPADPGLSTELELIRRLPAGAGQDGLDLTGVRLEIETPLVAPRIKLDGCELSEVVIAPTTRRDGPGSAAGHRRLSIFDTALDGCDLSNVRCVDSDLRRVRITRSRLVGFDLGGGRAHDLTVHGSSLSLASLADCGLQSVRFEGCDLREATFTRARLRDVEFIDCRLEGADFRQVRLDRCAIRGASLDGVIGVDSLRGLTMPSSDVIGSAAALAAGLGISVEAADGER
jgi:uncharacterized protein YjbI with pentapeptide repeats